MILILHILKELFTEDRLRIVLSILAVAWGTTSIVIMLAIGQGLRLTVNKAMQGVGEDLLLAYPGQTSRPYKGTSDGVRIRLNHEDVEYIKKTVIQTISGEYLDSSIKARYKDKDKDNLWNGRILGVDSRYEAMRNILIQPGGRFISPEDMRLGRRVAVIGAKVAKSLFGEMVDPVGKSIKINSNPFRVIGVTKRKFQLLNIYALDEEHIWIPGQTFRSLYGHPNYASLVINAVAPGEMPRLKKALREAVAYRKGVDPEDEEILEYLDISEAQAGTKALSYGLQIFLGLVGTLTLVVAGIGIGNTMYILVNNATRDIGIRMAVGARGYQILGQYICGGLVSTAIGGLIGLGISSLVIWAVGQIPLEGDFFDRLGDPSPVLSIDVFLTVVAILGVIATFASYFPARKAAQVDPVDALRYE